MTPTFGDEQTSRRWLWLLPLVALVLSVMCVTSSTFLALSLWPTEISQAQMLAESEADYGREPASAKFAPLSPQIIFEATNDSLGLMLTPASSTQEATGAPVAERPVQLLPTLKATSADLPTAVVVIATLTPLPTAGPTSEPDRPTPRPTTTSSPPTETIPPLTATATATQWPTVIASSLPTNTATAVPPTYTATPQPMPTPIPTQLPSPTPQPTSLPTRTPPPPPPLPTVTPTVTATPTSLPTATPTASATSTPLPTNTPTLTPTPINTPTNTPVPCTGNIPGGEPNIGLPNGILAHIGCGQNLVVDLGAVKAIAVTGSAEPAFDIVYYELENPATNVNLDWVIVEIGTSPSGPWHQVFYWGDDILDANTNIGQLGYGAGSEPDNQSIPFADLYGGNSPGIAIDVDAVVPAGNYRWVRITAPLGGANDASEVDSLGVLP